MFKVPEKYRIIKGPGASQKWNGNNGNFIFRRKGVTMLCIVSDEKGWEYCNVSIHSKGGKKQLDRFPTWEEMSFVKSQFWGQDDTVFQFHPPAKDYKYHHKNCLYLWRFAEVEMLAPLPEMLKGFNDAT